MQQLYDRDVMNPLSPRELSKEEKSEALAYLMFFKQKRDGRIKGRGCADGRKQRRYNAKSEASSPIISMEVVFLVVTIAAKERSDVATIDIPRAFMQTDLSDDGVHIRLEGYMVELLSMIEPLLYRQHIFVERGKPVLYSELKKALYGMLQASLRFWNQVLDDLIGLGFTVNPYDWCVANRIIEGTQEIMGWHVDDFIITHHTPKVNSDLIAWFEKKYGGILPLVVQRSKTHD